MFSAYAAAAATVSGTTTSSASPFLLRPSSPLDLLSTQQKLSLGCPILNRLLAGGLPVGTLTEISGESSTGKSQICLQLLLSSLLPPYLGGLSSSSLLIVSSAASPLLRRLRHLHPPPPHLLPPNSPSPLDHIFIASAQSPSHLLLLLSQADQLFANSPSDLPVKLLIVDSIADIFRSEFDNSLVHLKNRTGLFFKVAAKLKEQAYRFGSVSVVTNQVVDVMESSGEAGNHMGPTLWSSGRRISPAMGLSWANCVNTRIFLSRSNDMAWGDDDLGTFLGTHREMQIMFAPHVPRSTCKFVIRGDGVFGVDGNST